MYGNYLRNQKLVFPPMYVQYKKSKELPKCTGLLLLDKLIEYLSHNLNVLRTSITVAINYYFFSKIFFGEFLPSFHEPKI